MNSSKDVEIYELLYVIRGNINDSTTLEKSLALSQDVKHIVCILAILLLDMYPREL